MTLEEFRQLGRRRRSGGAYVRRRPEGERAAESITFDSKAERLRFEELRALQRAGEILWIIRQPPFDLAGVRYRADFLIAWRTGLEDLDNKPLVRITVEEVKGKGSHPEVLRRWRRNAVQVRELYGLDVTLVER